MSAPPTKRQRNDSESSINRPASGPGSRGPYKKRQKTTTTDPEIERRLQRDASLIPDECELKTHGTEDTPYIMVGTTKKRHGGDGKVWLKPTYIEDKKTNGIALYTIGGNGVKSQASHRSVSWLEPGLSSSVFHDKGTVYEWVAAECIAKHREWLLFVWCHQSGLELPQESTKVSGVGKGKKKMSDPVESRTLQPPEVMPEATHMPEYGPGPCERAFTLWRQYNKGEVDIKEDATLATVLKAYKQLHKGFPEPSLQILRDAYAEREKCGAPSCTATQVWADVTEAWTGEGRNITVVYCGMPEPRKRESSEKKSDVAAALAEVKKWVAGGQTGDEETRKRAEAAWTFVITSTLKRLDGA